MMNPSFKIECIRLTQKECQKAIDSGNPPFGAVFTDKFGTVIETAYNTQNTDTDPTAHAEINLLRKVGKKLKTRYLSEYYLFGNAEPCSMCMSGAIKAKTTSFYFGAPYEKTMDPLLSAQAAVAEHAQNKIHVEGGILQQECEEQIRQGRARLENKK